MVNIQIKSLCYQRAEFKLRIPSLSIAPGEKIALMGENGCGKSTLINLMSGLITPAAASVYYQDNPIESIAHHTRARLFSVLPQFCDISFPFSVFEVIRLGRFAHLKGNSFAPDDTLKTEHYMELLGLTHYKDRSFAQLSGGEKRRVMIARVLNQEASVIYLDEPMASLDIRHSLEILRHLNALSQTVICSVHDINLAYHHFERFIFFKHGELLFDLRRDEITEQQLAEVYDVSVTTDPSRFSFCL